MHKLKAFRLFFSLAALLFLAKPFVGFGIIYRQAKTIKTHTILVKSFTKRKPEGIEEADDNIRAVHQLLTNPPLFLQSAIAIVLLIFLPLTLKFYGSVINWLLYKNRHGLLPPEHTYLLTGQLII